MAHNTFELAVQATADLTNDCYQTGLKALKSHSLKITLEDPLECTGSVDIDTCLTFKYPQSNRWDYCFCYKSEAYFVEVHAAYTGEVSTVLKKLQWLKDWLNNEAPEINLLRARSKPPFYWIQSNNFKILPGSSQYRQVIQKGIKPIPKLILA